MNDSLLPVEEARQRILALVRPGPAESTRIADAIGRALAEDVRAVRTLPPWPNSAMDGYAVRTADLSNPPASLRIVEEIFAGQRPSRAVAAGECARIMTGAKVPDGADAVVMQEKVRLLPDGQVEFDATPERGANIRDAGEDAREGELLLPAGTAIGVPEAALLWAQGLTHAPVHRRPRVAILSSGDELCAVGEVKPDCIVDTNSQSLALLVQRAGGEASSLGIARDTMESVMGKLEKARGHDLILTSAGVSVGEKDHVRPALERVGARMDFWRVALKPGKPLAVGVLEGALVIALPGNPVSSLVTFELFVRPALRRMAGLLEVDPPRVPGRLDGTLAKKTGITHYVRAKVAWREGALWATPLASQTSGALRSAASATHLIELPAASAGAQPGSEVTLIPVSWTAGA